MILQNDQIKNIILNNPNKATIQCGRVYNKTMRRHLYGEDLDCAQIKGMEADDVQQLRKKYARSNKDLFSRLSRPIDKIFTAKGGSTYYNLSGTLDKLARGLALNVKKGISIRDWIENTWKPHLLDDPYGLVFLEILPLQQAVLAKQQGRSFVYPTYKAITSVYDYQVDGLSIEYVVFNVTDADKKKVGIDDDKTYYRVVDDAMDYWVRKEDGETITILADHSIQNYFGYVPALLNSDILDPQHDDNFATIFHDILELARHFFLFNSIKLTYEFMLAFPKYWQYLTACNKCNGTGMHSGVSCEDCNGTGSSFMKKVSDIMGLKFPETKDDAIVAPYVAGFISPPKDYYEISTSNLESIEKKMSFTIWGTNSKAQTSGMSIDAGGTNKTATEVVNDIKPESDRLEPISKMAEKRHKFILDPVVRLNLNLPSYQGSSVNYGRRYMIESPDEIWDKYENARTKGAAASVLDDLLNEYYESKYASDPIKLAIQTKLMKVEPFVHLTASNVEALQNVTAEDKTAKSYFTEWLSGQSDAIILIYTEQMLRDSLKAFCADKVVALNAEAVNALAMEAQYSYRLNAA
jgi:hypothetical protein